VGGRWRWESERNSSHVRMQESRCQLMGTQDADQMIQTRGWTRDKVPSKLLWGFTRVLTFHRYVMSKFEGMPLC
jgi:hypothetical protein